ncbi:MAG: VWA domain-containing protein, partial [Candidatus Aminicenantes bacterium]|nr:VWA domain-containing protein [Candidatus Aminicenantes bacterium]
MRKSVVYLCVVILSIHLCGVYLLGSYHKQEQYRHEVAVTLKLIQVYVTDKSGSPVTGLGVEEFELFDNGKRVPITAFEEYDFSYPPAEADQRKKKEDLPAYKEKMNRKFFIFFDFAFNNASGIKKSKEAALHFIDTKLHPDDELGLISYSAIKGLVLHKHLTTRHDEVKNIIESFGAEKVLGRTENIEGLFWYGSGDKTKDPFLDQSPLMPSDELKLERMGKFLRGERNNLIKQAHFFALDIARLAKALRYIPGYKNFIFLSSGINGSLMYGIGAPFGNIKKGSWGDTILRNAYEKMTKELAASNSRFYALDSEELSSALKMDYQMTGASSLKALSQETGGKYFTLVGDYKKTLEEINDTTLTYYVLGYDIDEKWDGAYHKIEVKVKRKGCKVHAQAGYFNPKPFSEFSDLEKRIHLVDTVVRDKPYFGDLVRFPMTAQFFLIEKKPFVLAVSKFERERLREVLGKDSEIYSIILDKDKNIIFFKKKDLNLKQFPEKDIYFHYHTPLKRGDYQCFVVIRNNQTGRTAKSTSFLSVPETEDKDYILSTPLLIQSQVDTIFLGAKLGSGENDLFITDIFPFDHSLYAPV